MADRSEERTRLVTRRGFLQGSTTAAFAICVVSSFPAYLFAAQGGQDAPPKTDDGKKTEAHDDEKDTDARKNDTKDNVPNLKAGSKEEETRRDAAGLEYRVCPQCGSNMYRQNQTWTCENCGYSYVE